MLLAAEMPLPEGQVELGGEDGWVGRGDFDYRNLKLVIEIDGKAWHTRYLDKLSDKRRDAALRAAGFEVEHVKEEELEDPVDVIRRVRQARADRSAALLAAG